MSEMLKKARAYEAEKAAQTDKNTRPLFHISAPAGWINDPNGFSVYDGKIHLFYQYYPYAREWGPMHWGHSVTTDMISWEQLPAALAPDQDYDRNGCFSGSAIEADNKHVLVYTGVTKITLPDGREEERQNQCIAFGDGRDYVKYENNPVVTGEMLPENCSRIDFRDPKIWKEEDTYYLIVGSKDNRQIGQVVLCSSKDLKEWKFETVLAANSTGKVGTMWECPDFFPLGDKHVLICSPQNMKAEKYEFHNGNNSIYFVGEFDKGEKKFDGGEPLSLDYGTDFYAPQTTLLPDGRRIMIAWMQSWHNLWIPGGQKWQGMMTIPREISLKNGRLIQKPVREIEKYHANMVRYSDEVVSGRRSLEGISGRSLDVTFVITGNKYSRFTVNLAKGSGYYTRFIYDRENNIIEMDRTFAGFEKDVVCIRRACVKSAECYGDVKGKVDEQQEAQDSIKLRFILDRNSIELFVNDGAMTMSTAIYTPIEADGIELLCEGQAVVDVEKYDII